jgi:myo-inositol-1(or 4)-monophosphatase
MAGRIATSFSGASAKCWDKPGGAGPVTEADLAVNAFLLSSLRQSRPDYGWLSEESEDDTERLNKDRVFIIDPIDGTRSFVEGANTWAHSLAIAEKGRVTAAVVYLPLRDKLYTAALGQGAALNGTPITASQTHDITQSEILAAKPALQPGLWHAGQAPDFKRVYRPSLAYRLALIAQGRFDGMLTLRKSWEWDIAAGALIVAEAGGIGSDRTGGPLTFNNPDPRLNGVVVAGAQLHGSLQGALA